MRLGGLEIVDQLVWLHGQGWPRPHPLSLAADDDVAASLKPAATPILLARSPILGSLSDTWTQHGTGLLRLTTTRVGHRHPANVVLSHEPACTDETCIAECPVNLLDVQSGRLKARGNANPTRSGGGSGASGPAKAVVTDHGQGDEGGASRFFYCARPSASERNAGLAHAVTNEHPSVKPVALMRYLIELVTPPGGTVLDPFVGSGTTAVAAVEAATRCVGIDRDDDGLYLPIAVARVRHAGVEPQLHDDPTHRGIGREADGEVAEDLRLAARRLRRAEHRIVALRSERDALVGQARDAGLTWREIALLGGLSSPQAAERIGRSAAPDG
jgi:site-specific DNA-methyltransferase (adenine-specific)